MTIANNTKKKGRYNRTQEAAEARGLPTIQRGTVEAIESKGEQREEDCRQ